MSITEVLATIEAEIVRLQQARALLRGFSAAPATSAKKTRVRRKLSKAARTKIAAAQKARWAKIHA